MQKYLNWIYLNFLRLNMNESLETAVEQKIEILEEEPPSASPWIQIGVIQLGIEKIRFLNQEYKMPYYRREFVHELRNYSIEPKDFKKYGIVKRNCVDCRLFGIPSIPSA